MTTREEMKAEVEEVGRRHGHTLGPWLDLVHASQVGCLSCERWAFVQVLPEPGQLHLGSLERDCPQPQGGRPERPGDESG